MKEFAPENPEIRAAIARVEAMERRFDALLSAGPEAVLKDAALLGQLEALIAYYEGGQWLKDYALDDAGLLPPELRRGVLSEDAVYDFLTDVDAARQSGNEA